MPQPIQYPEIRFFGKRHRGSFFAEVVIVIILIVILIVIIAVIVAVIFAYLCGVIGVVFWRRKGGSFLVIAPFCLDEMVSVAPSV